MSCRVVGYLCLWRSDPGVSSVQLFSSSSAIWKAFSSFPFCAESKESIRYIGIGRNRGFSGFEIVAMAHPGRRGKKLLARFFEKASVRELTNWSEGFEKLTSDFWAVQKKEENSSSKAIMLLLDCTCQRISGNILDVMALKFSFRKFLRLKYL